MFAIQEEISRKIVNALQLRLTDAEARGIAERPIDNAAAYDCYMRARHEVYRFTADGLDRAQKLVDAGLSLIGENSLLLATRGMVSWYYLNFSIRPRTGTGRSRRIRRQGTRARSSELCRHLPSRTGGVETRRHGKCDT